MAQSSVAALLKEMRDRRGESLRAAARGLGVDASYLSRIENGSRVPSTELQDRASKHYGLDPDLVQLAAGRVPDDVVRILRDHPEVLQELRTLYGD